MFDSSNGLILIAKIEEIDAEIGDPNCKISDAALVNSDDTVALGQFALSKKICCLGLKTF